MPEWPWWNVKDRKMTIFDGGEVPFEASSLSQVAKTIVNILSPQRLEETKNQYVFTHSATLTQNSLLSIFEDLTGSKWNTTANSVKAINAIGKESFRRLTNNKSLDELRKDETLEGLGNVLDFQISIVMMISSGCFGLGGGNQFGEKAKYWTQQLRLVEEDVESVLREALADQIQVVKGKA